MPTTNGKRTDIYIYVSNAKLEEGISQKKCSHVQCIPTTTQSAKKPAIIAKRAAIPLLVVKELAADEVVAVEEELVSVEVEGAEEVAPELVAAPLDTFPPLAVPLVVPVVVAAPEEVAVPVPVVVALAVPEADEKGTELDVDAVIVTEMPMNERVSSRPW